MKKETKTEGMRLGLRQAEALDKIVSLFNSEGIERRHSCVYVLEVDGGSLTGELVVHIQDMYAEGYAASIRYIRGDMFKLECHGATVLLTGNEVLDYLKKLELVR